MFSCCFPLFAAAQAAARGVQEVPTDDESDGATAKRGKQQENILGGATSAKVHREERAAAKKSEKQRRKRERIKLEKSMRAEEKAGAQRATSTNKVAGEAAGKEVQADKIRTAQMLERVVLRHAELTMKEYDELPGYSDEEFRRPQADY